MSKLGEDIRHAKAIYEDKHGNSQTEVTVMDWIRFANEVKEYLKLDTYQQVTNRLGIKVKRVGMLND